MYKSKKQAFAILTPKTDKGKERMAHYGNKWVISNGKRSFNQDTTSSQLCLMSRDGSRCLFVKRIDDPDFTVRIEGE